VRINCLSALAQNSSCEHKLFVSVTSDFLWHCIQKASVTDLFTQTEIQ